MLKTFLLFGTLTMSTGLSAQNSTPPLPNAPQISNWQSIKSLSAGTTVYVKSNTAHSRCNVKSVSDDSFICNGGPEFKRSEIETIKRPNRLVSTLVGTGIGVGVGVLIGEATFKNDTPGYNRAGAAIGGGVLFGSIGALVGYFTDFTHPTLYRKH